MYINVLNIKHVVGQYQCFGLLADLTGVEKCHSFHYERISETAIKRVMVTTLKNDIVEDGILTFLSKRKKNYHNTLELERQPLYTLFSRDIL